MARRKTFDGRPLSALLVAAPGLPLRLALRALGLDRLCSSAYILPSVHHGAASEAQMGARQVIYRMALHHIFMPRTRVAKNCLVFPEKADGKSHVHRPKCHPGLPALYVRNVIYNNNV
ncbi:hypothetical protein RRG08_012268 [Elysia crispata]|uniref:Uncharacterized protein n=1 Tax=Elysia crispata TaxID=231223 RepID=A0AAE1EE88_9GAST|nr:hypothetical protein RRG08_012268 [Elysia crispata]